MASIARQSALSLVVGVVLILGAGAAHPATRPGAAPAAPPAPANAPADARADAKPPAGERVPLAPVGELREMADAEREESLAARDAADVLRANYEKAHGAGRGKAAGGAGAGENLAFVVTAYRQAIDRCPGSELECYCRLGLAGAYQYRGQFDATLNEARQAAERFAGTPPGLQAAQAVALIHLQALHDPAQAAPWFRKLQAAAAVVKDDAERLKWQSAAAEGLARCDAERGAGKK
jgi:hypothetical protein